MIYFSSDWHLFHKNIIEYCKRPFSDEFEMSYRIIQNFKEVLTPEDTLIFVGDLTIKTSKKWIDWLAKLINDIPGNRILVRGNHDLYPHEVYKKFGFKLIVDFISSDSVLIAHDPAQKAKGKNMICGHVHEKWKVKTSEDGTVLFNVGVDQHRFQPVSIDEIPFEIPETLKRELTL